MDSLRYWVTEMHVDGFRFDLASTLARELHEVDRLSAFFDLIQQDPVVVAGEADRRAVGRRRGRLPGRQLPAAVVGVERPLPRHDPRLLARRAGRRSPSSATASPAAPTCTRPTPAGRRHRSTSSPPTTASRCADLVSYNDKHNEANGEDNRDGETHNRSWNCGVEGPTDDPAVLALRARQRRNLLTTLLLSQGVPMLLGGDELGRTQRRQQQRLLPGQRDLVVRLGRRRRRRSSSGAGTVAALRRDHPVFRRRRWFQGRAIRGIEDIAWFRPDGADDDRRRLGDRLRQVGRRVPQRRRDPDHRRLRWADRRRHASSCMFNASELDLPWTVPGGAVGADWVGRARHRPRARAGHRVSPPTPPSTLVATLARRAALVRGRPPAEHRP